ncbi:vWA domain-containing protein [Corynebacterium sp. 335C]
MPGTVVAAAERGARLGGPGEVVELTAADLRGAVRQGTESNLIVFLVDASGSMAARDRLSAVTGAVSSLLRDAYQRRDKVAVVTFRGDGAEVALPPTRSTDAAARRLADLRTGGRTPLAEGLAEATRILERERRREPGRRALLVVLSDGRATGRDGLERARAAAGALRRRNLAGAVVVDCESGRIRLGLAAELARGLGGPCVRLDALDADAVAGVVHAGL